jgi:hypothetical protein
MSRVYLYTLISLILIWLGLIIGGVVAIKTLVTLNKPAPSPSPSIAEIQSLESPIEATPNPSLEPVPAIAATSSEAVPWRSLGLIALSCAIGTLMVAQRLNSPPRRTLSRSHSRKP